MGGIGVIVNPHARGNKNAPGRVEAMRAIVGSDGEVVATRDLEDAERTLGRFADDGIEVLGVCGGDGSFHHVIELALGVWGDKPLPLLLPLRGGTINNLARTIRSAKSKPEAMLELVVRNRREGNEPKLTERELVVVNGKHYGQIFGAGLIVNFLQLYYAGSNPGPASAFRLLIRGGLSYFAGTSFIGEIVDPFGARVHVDGDELRFDRFSMFLASTVEHIGLGVKPFYLSGKPGSGFHCIGGPATPGELLTRLPLFFAGRPSRLASLFDGAASDVDIEFDAPQAFTVNGEIFPAVPALRLERGPAISFICG